MQQIVEVNNRSIAATDTDAVQNTIGIETVSISFDDEWEGYETYRCVFENGSDVVALDFDYANPVELEIPWEVLANEGRLLLSVLAYKDGKRLVTKAMAYPIKVSKSGRIEGRESTEATQDEITRLMNMVEDTLADMEARSNAATQAAIDAADKAQAAADSANSTIDRAVNEVVTDAVAAEVAKQAGITFAVDSDDGGLNIIYNG